MAGMFDFTSQFPRILHLRVAYCGLWSRIATIRVTQEIVNCVTFLCGPGRTLSLAPIVIETESPQGFQVLWRADIERFAVHDG